eukprot:g5475.t1
MASLDLTCGALDPPSSDQYKAIAFSSTGSNIIAGAGLGSKNKAVSTDGGLNWIESTNSELSAGWADMAMSFDGSTIIGVEFFGSVRVSTDGASTWTTQTGPPTVAWLSTSISDDGQLMAAVANGQQIYISSDGGLNWNARDSNRDWVGIAVASDKSKILAAVDGGLLYISPDNGTSFSSATNTTSELWNAVAVSSDGMVMYAAVRDNNDGKIWRSSDSGVDWSELTNSPSGLWTSISTSSDGTIIFGSIDGGNLHISEDSGVSWAASADTGSFHKVAITADGSIRGAVTDDGSGQVYMCPDDET